MSLARKTRVNKVSGDKAVLASPGRKTEKCRLEENPASTIKTTNDSVRVALNYGVLAEEARFELASACAHLLSKQAEWSTIRLLLKISSRAILASWKPFPKWIFRQYW